MTITVGSVKVVFMIHDEISVMIYHCEFESRATILSETIKIKMC
jgi:hypothetical protein